MVEKRSEGERMSDHKEMNKKSKTQRGFSRRAQLRQQQKAIQTLNLKLKDCIDAMLIHYNKVQELGKELEKARRLTPEEKANWAYQQQLRMAEANKELCKIGACWHDKCESGT